MKRVLNVEKATFTPAIFLTTGGMSKKCKRLVDRVADLIARKRKERYCDVARHVRTCVGLIPNHPHDMGLKFSPGEILAKNYLDHVI